MYRKLSFIARSVVKRRQYFSRPFSTRPAPSSTPSTAALNEGPPQPASVKWADEDVVRAYAAKHFPDHINFRKKFEEDFSAPDNAQWNSIRSGSYQKILESDLAAHLPEGLPKKLTQRFAEYGDSSWMIRDCSKFVAQYIDYARKSLKPALNDEGVKSQTNTFAKIRLPRLTDRADWPGTQFKCQFYGQDISKAEVEEGNESQIDIPWGEQSIGGKIINNLKGKVPDKVLLSGERGTGKSIVLNQIVLHARKSGWLCLYVHNGWEQVNAGLFIEDIPNHPKLYDNYFMTKSIFRSFLKAHYEQLKQLPITRTQCLNTYLPPITKYNENWARVKKFNTDAKTFLKIRTLLQGEDPNPEEDALDEEFLRNFELDKFQLQTLADLVLLGIALPEFSGLAFMDLVEELKIIESIPVLIAVDEYNTWFNHASFMIENQRIDGFQIVVPHSLKFIGIKRSETENFKLKNGLCIGSTTLSKHEGLPYSLKDIAASVPLHVTIPTYNRWEYVSAFSYCSKFSMVGESSALEDAVLFRTFTSSVPWRIDKETPSYFVWRLSEDYNDLFWPSGEGNEIPTKYERSSKRRNSADDDLEFVEADDESK